MTNEDIDAINEPIKCWPTKNKSGIAMMEMLVALSLLVLAFAGAFKAFIASRALFLSAKDEGVVTQLAQSRIERLEVIDFNELHLWGETNLIVNSQGVPEGDGRYRVSTFITSGATTNEMDITVSVSYRSRTTGDFTEPKEFITTRI